MPYLSMSGSAFNLRKIISLSRDVIYGYEMFVSHFVGAALQGKNLPIGRKFFPLRSALIRVGLQLLWISLPVPNSCIPLTKFRLKPIDVSNHLNLNGCKAWFGIYSLALFMYWVMQYVSAEVCFISFIGMADAENWCWVPCR